MEHIARFLFLHQIFDALTTNNKPKTIDQQYLPPKPQEIVIDKQGQGQGHTDVWGVPQLATVQISWTNSPLNKALQGAMLLVEWALTPKGGWTPVHL